MMSSKRTVNVTASFSNARQRILVLLKNAENSVLVKLQNEKQALYKLFSRCSACNCCHEYNLSVCIIIVNKSS